MAAEADAPTILFGAFDRHNFGDDATLAQLATQLEHPLPSRAQGVAGRGTGLGATSPREIGT